MCVSLCVSISLSFSPASPCMWAHTHIYMIKLSGQRKMGITSTYPRGCTYKIRCCL